MKNRTRRYLSLVLAALMMFSTVFNNTSLSVRAEGATESVAEWHSTTRPADLPTIPAAATGGSGVLDAVGASGKASTSKGITAEKWSVGSYWSINFDATGFENLTFTADMAGSGTGPAHFVLSGSSDGENWENLSDVITLTATSTAVFKDVALPAHMSDKPAFLRITVADTASIKDASVDFAAGGTTALKDIYIKGTRIGGASEEIEPQCEEVFAGAGSRTVLIGEEVALHTNTEGASIFFNTDGTDNYVLYESPISILDDTTVKAFSSKEGLKDSIVKTFTFTIAKCDAVAASISAGSVAENTEVSLSTKTADATIMYSIDGSEEFAVYENPFVITKDTVINAYALKDGYKNSETSTFAYSVIVPESNILGTVSNGDSFVIFSTKANSVLTSTVNGKKLQGIDASVDADVLTIVKTDDNKAVADTVLKLTANECEDGSFTFTDATGKFLTTSATGNSMSLTETIDDYCYWTIETSNSGATLIGNKNAAYVKNEVAIPQYIEYYNGFTTYSFTKGTTNEAAYELVLFKNATIDDQTTPEGSEPEEPEEPDDGDEEELPANNCLTEVKDGQVVVIYINKNVMSANASGSVLAGIAAEPDANGNLEAPKDAAFLRVVYDAETGFYAFKNALTGKYLTSGPTGSKLTFEDSLSDLGLWELEKQENGFYVKNKEAKYNNTNAQYLEYYKNFTTYSLKSGGVAYLTNFYTAEVPVAVDESISLTIAKWAGTVTESDIAAFAVNGDLYADADKADANAVYSVVKAGKTATVQSASNASYMGAREFGGENTYAQFKLSSLGYGNLKLSLRFRITATAAPKYQFAYSTDGVNFTNFTTGYEKVSYTAYTSEGSSEVTKEAAITDGIFTALVDSQYHTLSFDVPSKAQNAENLYVRIYPIGGKYNGKDGAPAGNIRLDNVKFTANPLIDPNVCGYVKATPSEGEVAVGEELTLSSSTEGATIYYSVNGGEYKVYDSAAKPVLSELPAVYSVYAAKEGVKNSIVMRYSYSQSKCETPKATPNGGAVRVGTMVKLSALTEGAEVYYRFAEQDEWTLYTSPVELKELPVTMSVISKKNGCLDSEVRTLNFTQKSTEKYNTYFGQIHAHTNFSDGAGSCEEAFAHASKVDNLDFIAITDHSNSLDNAANGDITKNVDTSETDEWTMGHNLAKKYSSDSFTCLYGYEMTWSNGLGHMNTFNTPGFQSRTQSAYSTYATALNNYYSALELVPDSISMFNHPGTTFGDFQDFAYYSANRDELINLIEVGNGEGAIGSSGYFPSYEYYTRALDKGWHVAPTNNQDNHKGLWGDANTARTVVLADANNEAEIYQAMKDRRIYATEDNNLNIYYTLNGFIMGSVLDKEDVADTVNLKVEIKDADAESIGKVQVIVNGGIVADEKKVTSGEAVVDFTIPSNYSYYYIKIVEEDGDIAVTAPVWVGEVEACGLNGVSTSTTLAVSGETIDIQTDFYNNESTPLTITEISIDAQDAEGNLTHVVTLTGDALKEAFGSSAEVASNSTKSLVYNYIYNAAGKVNYIVSAKADMNGTEKAYTGKLSVNYVAPSMVADVIIDGTHANDYVTGYYGGNMANFISMCADYSLRATVVKDKITSETLKNAKLLLISAPAGRSGTANTGDYVETSFDAEFIEVVKDYVRNGGSVVICGLADYGNYHAAAEQNKILEAIGSTIRLNSDEVMDDTNNGGQAYRLYPENFAMDSEFLKGVVSKKDNASNFQLYSQYSGCSVNVSNAEETEFVNKATALVRGFDTTYSVDCKDENGKSYGNNIVLDNKGDITFLAHQSTKAGGDIFVAGGVFLSDFEVKAEIDNNDSLPYANYTIAKNILAKNEVEIAVTPIAEVRKAAMGDVFAIEGYVTNGTDNEFTTFFDTIYVQDDTAGIDIFPYATAGLKIGTKVRIVGYVAAYQGDLELKVISSKILDEPSKVYEPKVVSTKDAMDYDNFGGSLLKTTGVVSRVLIENGVVSEFWIKDSTGKEAAIFIDGYIYSATTGKNELADFVKEGATVSAVGLLYMHPEGNSEDSVPVFRVRNCDEIKLEADMGKNGVYEENGRKYLYINDVKAGAGLHELNGEIYYTMSNGMIQTGEHYIKSGNALDLPYGRYLFDENGCKSHYTGFAYIDGVKYFYKDGFRNTFGLVEFEGDYYYISSYGKVITGDYFVNIPNGYVEKDSYLFDEDGKLSNYTGIANNYYYTNGRRIEAGLVEFDGKYYYVKKHGVLAIGDVYVKNTNGLKEFGYYWFNTDGTMSSFTGFRNISGDKYYYQNGLRTALGLIEVEGEYYYTGTRGRCLTGVVYVFEERFGITKGHHTFDEEGKFVE